MPRITYFDLFVKLKRLGDDDLRALDEEFNPFVPRPIDSDRLDYLRSRVGPLLARLARRFFRSDAHRIVRVLGYTKDPRAVEPMLDMLVGPQRPIQHYSAVEDALVMIGEPAVQGVLDAFEALAAISDTRRTSTECIIRTLSRLEDPRAIPALFGYLRTSKRNHDIVLRALEYLTRERTEEREQLISFIRACASNADRAIEKGLWPRYRNDGISDLNVMLIQGRYQRALRRFVRLARARSRANFGVPTSAARR